MAKLLCRAPSSRWWPLKADDVTAMTPCSNHSMGAGGVGVTPGVPASTDGLEGAGGRTAGGGLAADGEKLRTVGNGSVKMAKVCGHIPLRGQQEVVGLHQLHP